MVVASLTDRYRLSVLMDHGVVEERETNTFVESRYPSLFVLMGVADAISRVFFVTTSRLTKRNGHKGWIRNNLNASHLDYYYAFFAVLNLLNFIFFLVMTKFYVYKAEVSDSMIILEEELKLKSAATDHEVVAKQEAASRFNLT
ncbi:NRT1/ PTR family 5.2-like protein [Tanacetum coccineum]